MSYNTLEVPFTNELRKYLARIGYTHVLNVGVTRNESTVEGEEAYLLIPLKASDKHSSNMEVVDKIQTIDANDIIDMANGFPFIRFVLKISIKEFELYLNL